MDAISEINLLLEECRRLANGLPERQMGRLAEERAEALGCAMGHEDAVAGMAILQMSRDKEPWPLPKWAGPEMAAAVEKAREFRQALETGIKMGRY